MDFHLQRTTFNHLKFGHVCDFTHLFLIENINIPGIIVQRLILKHLEHICPLSFWQNISRKCFIIQTGNLSVSVHGHAVIWSFNVFSTNGKLGLSFFCFLFFKDNGSCSHRRNIFHFHIGNSSRLLCIQLIPLLIPVDTCSLVWNCHNFASLPSGGIKYRIAVLFILDNMGQSIFLHTLCHRLDIFIIFSGIFIYLMNRRTRNNIMELICQNVFPAFCQFFLSGICKPSHFQSIHNRQPFCIAVQKLHFSIHTLIICLTCIGSSMILQIQFSIPCMHILVCIFHSFLQISEIFCCRGSFQVRKSRYLINTTSVFQHIPVDPAAAITKSISNQQLLVHLLFTVCIPGSFDSFWNQLSIVGIKPGSRFIPWFWCSNKMCQNLAAINSFPFESIMRHTVILIPTDLCCHKSINPGFFQNLWKCPGISEHIRKPQVLYIFTEFILDKFASKKNLPCKRFSAGKITVRFHPHSTVCFPAAFRYTFLYFFINIRELLFHIFI